VEKAQAEFDGALASLHPSEIARVMEAPNPLAAAVGWLRQRELLAEVGSDPKAYRERILKEALTDPEFLAQAIEAGRTAAGGRPRRRGSIGAQSRGAAFGQSRGNITWLPSDGEVRGERLAAHQLGDEPENGETALRTEGSQSEAASQGRVV
jgi:hypothetical protein